MTRKVIDAHVHLWDLTNPWYPGLKAMADNLDRPDLYRDFGLDDYRSAAGDQPVDAFVHVSAVTSPGTHIDELAWVTKVATKAGVDMRYIGTVDPTASAPEIVADLDRQLELTPDLVGIRVLYDFAPDSQAAATVLGWLTEHEKVFDLVTDPATMSAWVDRLATFDGLSVVLEHTGWPSGTDPAAQVEWLDAISLCARDTGARCKLSGLGMTTLDLSENALRPWLERAVDVFGWDRVIFGSNIPIEYMAGSYGELQQTLAAVFAGVADDDLDKFYYRNAASVYRLEDRA